MTPEQQAAYVTAMVACAMAEIAAMQAANQHCVAVGLTLKYDEEHFRAVIDRYGIHHNAVIEMFGRY